MPEPSWLSLFNRRAFYDLNTPPADAWISIPYVEGDETVAVLCGALRDDIFTAGFSAPFGGPDFSRPDETPARVISAVDHTLSELVRLGPRRLRVRCRPPAWAPNEPLVQFALLNRGFRVETADLSYTLDLRPYPDAESYAAALKKKMRHALRQSLSEPITFDEPEEWDDGFAVLEENRRAHGRSWSLSRTYVERLAKTFPRQVRMFVLSHHGRTCAAALVLSVSPGRWYVQNWGDAFHALKHSPMVVLTYRLVERAIAEGVAAIDLGAATEPAGPGAPLQVAPGTSYFKSSVLAVPQLRPVLVR